MKSLLLNRKKNIYLIRSQNYFSISIHILYPTRILKKKRLRVQTPTYLKKRNFLTLTNFIFNFLLKIDSKVTNIISYLPFPRTISFYFSLTHVIILLCTHISNLTENEKDNNKKKPEKKKNKHETRLNFLNKFVNT